MHSVTPNSLLLYKHQCGQTVQGMALFSLAGKQARVGSTLPAGALQAGVSQAPQPHLSAFLVRCIEDCTCTVHAGLNVASQALQELLGRELLCREAGAGRIWCGSFSSCVITC